MRRHVVAVTVTAMVATLAITGLTQTASARAIPTGVMVRTNAQAVLPSRGGTVDSLNWSGYVVTPSGGGVTGVTSTFVVPQAGLLPPGFAATWTGIGGFSTPDLIQAGVAEESLPSLPVVGPQYFAWYELLPGGEIPLAGCAGDPNCTVTPGEPVRVSINQVSGSTWRIAMAVAGRWTWARNVVYQSSRASAEWILEAPSLLGLQTIITPVGVASFGPSSTYTVAKSSHTIAAGHPTRIILTPGLIDEATPSPLAADGQSFHDCTYAPSCAAP